MGPISILENGDIQISLSKDYIIKEWPNLNSANFANKIKTETWVYNNYIQLITSYNDQNEPKIDITDEDRRTIRSKCSKIKTKSWAKFHVGTVVLNRSNCKENVANEAFIGDLPQNSPPRATRKRSRTRTPPSRIPKPTRSSSPPTQYLSAYAQQRILELETENQELRNKLEYYQDKSGELCSKGTYQNGTKIVPYFFFYLVFKYVALLGIGSRTFTQLFTDLKEKTAENSEIDIPGKTWINKVRLTARYFNEIATHDFIDKATSLTLTIDGTPSKNQKKVGVGAFNENNKFHCIGLEFIVAGDAKTMLDKVKSILKKFDLNKIYKKTNAILSDTESAQQRMNKDLASEIKQASGNNVAIRKCSMHMASNIEKYTVDFLSQQSYTLLEAVRLSIAKNENFKVHETNVSLIFNEYIAENFPQRQINIRPIHGSRWSVHSHNCETIFKNYDAIQKFFQEKQVNHKRYDDIVMEKVPLDVRQIVLMELGTVALVWKYLNGPLWTWMSKPQKASEVKAMMTEIKSALDKDSATPITLIFSLRNSVFHKRNLGESCIKFGQLFHKKWLTLDEHGKKETNSYINKVIDRILQKLQADWEALLSEESSNDTLVIARENDGSLSASEQANEEQKLIWSNQQTERIFSNLRRQENIENLSEGNIEQCTIALNNNIHIWMANLPKEQFEYHVKEVLKKREEYRKQNEKELEEFKKLKTRHSEKKLLEEIEKNKKKEARFCRVNQSKKRKESKTQAKK